MIIIRNLIKKIIKFEIYFKDDFIMNIILIDCTLTIFII